MYCPKCFNDTLKIASSGVVKFSFDGKAKATSQFYYDLKHDQTQDIKEKLEGVIQDYFKYYSTFQNKEPLQNVEAHSIDFVCNNGCVISVNHKLNVIGLLFGKDMLKEVLETMAPQYQIPLDLKL